MKVDPRKQLGKFREELPRFGTAGSRSAHLHNESAGVGHYLQRSSDSQLPYSVLSRFAYFRFLGTVGALLLAIGGLGAGALPVVENPYLSFPFGSFLGRMLQTSTMLCFVGVGLLVLAWLLIAPFTGAFFFKEQRGTPLIPVAMLVRVLLAWTLPLLASAPMFTQDIYSYIANGAIVRQGLDPYSGGPVDILGSSDELARSVPFIWAHSPSPYGPVSLGIAAVISEITNDNIALAVFGHRIVSLAGVIAAAWALVHLARRCRVAPQAALWLGVLNPLTILHLIGGIHNEAVLLGLLLVGVEYGLRAVDRIKVNGLSMNAWGWIVLSGFLISCAGMVKVTGFIGLGFTGMAVARVLHLRLLESRENKNATVGEPKNTLWQISSSVLPIVTAAVIQLAILALSIAIISVITGIGLGWITGQGGAVSIRSWMSLSTSIGVIAGFFSMMLGLGDHTEAILTVTRMAILGLAGAFMIRMLLATYRGTISAIGGLGVATFVMVLCFPVVHPWYALWAILPLAAWANRPIFRISVTVYSTIIAFFVLPRGLGLPPSTIASIYAGSAIAFIIIMVIAWVAREKSGTSRIN